MNRRKRYFLMIAAMLLTLLCSFTVLAENSVKIVDMADLISDSQERKLQEQFTDIVNRHGADVAVVTVDSTGGKSPMDFADDYYDYNGYGIGSTCDGVMLVLSMEERDWWITTTGYGIRVFTDYGIDKIGDEILPDLKDGDYYEAFARFGRLCDAFYEEAENGQPFDRNHTYSTPMPLYMKALISLGIGLVIGLIVLGVLYAQLKSVKYESEAKYYVKNGSFHLSHSNDLYLYKNVTKVKIESESGGSSTHSSSSGSSHGGGGGKF